MKQIEERLAVIEGTLEEIKKGVIINTQMLSDIIEGKNTAQPDIAKKIMGAVMNQPSVKNNPALAGMIQTFFKDILQGGR